MDDPLENPSESDLEKIEKFLKDIPDKKTIKVRKNPKVLSDEEVQRLCTSIVGALSEFMDCYILLGFDVNGNSIVISNSRSDLESRALSTLAEDFLTIGGNNINMGFESDEDDDID
jgi:hypothetical protein